jgi:hypothetical protein
MGEVFGIGYLIRKQNLKSLNNTHMKALFYLVTLLVVWPFALIWAIGFLTAFQVNPLRIFESSNFWGISVVFWVLALMLIGPLHELMTEHLSSKKPTKL